MNILKNKFLAVMIATLGLVTIGAVSINLVVNGNYCNNLICEENLIFNPTPYKLATDVTASTGFTITRSTDNTANWSFQNIAHWRFQSSTQNAYVEFAKRLPYGPNRVGTCIAGLKFIGDGNGYALRVVNSTGGIVAETKLDFASSYQQVYTPAFSCDVTGERLVRIVRIETGTGATFGGGEVFYGQYKPQFGTIVTASDYYKWTPVVTNLGAGSGTAVGVAGRFGDRLVGTITFTKDATPGTGGSLVSFSIYPGLHADFSKVSNNEGGTVGAANANGIAGGMNTWLLGSNTLLLVREGGGQPGSFYTAGRVIKLEFSIPIQGWSSGAQITDQLGGNGITFSATNSGQVIPHATNTPLNLTIVKDNSSGSVSLTQWKVKSAGDYGIDVAATLLGPGSTPTEIPGQLTVYVNNTLRLFSSMPDVQRTSKTGSYVQYSPRFIISDELKLSVDDIVDVRISHFASNGSNVSATTENVRLSIVKRTPPAYAIPMGPVAVIATNTSGFSVPTNNSGIAVSGWTKKQDTHNAFNVSNGEFISPESGFYHIDAAYGFSSSSNSGFRGMDIFAPGQNMAAVLGIGTVTNRSAISGLVYLNQGEVLRTGPFQSSGGNLALSTSAAENRIHIYKVK